MCVHMCARVCMCVPASVDSYLFRFLCIHSFCVSLSYVVSHLPFPSACVGHWTPCVCACVCMCVCACACACVCVRVCVRAYVHMSDEQNDSTCVQVYNILACVHNKARLDIWLPAYILVLF